MAQRILYIHGFNSSPQSQKSTLTQAYLAKHFPHIGFYCPQIISSPRAAIEQLDTILASDPNSEWLLMGSSLGGFFSTYLSEKYNIKAVLINPAVMPHLLLADYIGEQINPYTGEVYQVTENHMNELKSLLCEKISAKNYLVMVQTGDEVLDYRQAQMKYQNCQFILQQGGDHSFVDYDKMLPDIVRFLQLTLPKNTKTGNTKLNSKTKAAIFQ